MLKTNLIKFNLIETVENFFEQKGDAITDETIKKLMAKNFTRQQNFKSSSLRITHNFAKGMLKILGWKICNKSIQLPAKIVFILGHHTSRVDFLLAVLIMFYFENRASVLTSDIYFRIPILRELLILFGASPLIKTRHTKNQAEELTKFLNTTTGFKLAISPEGSLKKKDYWHKGFYYIAEKTNAHIMPVKFNYAKKEITLGEAFLPTEVKNDMDKLRSFYKDSVGKYPELQTEVRLKNENTFRKD